MKLMRRFLKPYWKELIIGPSFKLAEAILELMLPLYMGKIIDYGIRANNTDYIIRTGIFMLTIALIGICCALICQYTASKVSQGVGTSMRNDIFQHIGSFSNKELDQFGTASLINRVTNDVNQIQVAVAMLIRLVIRAPFLCVGGIVMALSLDARLSVIIMIVLPIFILILSLTMRKTIPLYGAVQKKLDQISRVIRENLSGVRVIRAFAKVSEEKERFEDSNQEYEKTAIRVGRISALLNPLTTLVMNLAIVAILWYGGIRVNEGALEPGTVMSFITYMTQILAALIIISQLVVLYTKAFASLGRVNEIFRVHPSITEVEHPVSKWDFQAPAVEFNQVSMAYHEQGEAALSNISFQAMQGETIGIIGGTGSGKSTLVNLIPRLYDATKGEVKVFGVNVKEAETRLLLDTIGVVPQKTVLFSGTIAENICWGKEDASEQEIKQAARIAQAEEFIERLPEQYHTSIRQGGVNVSGGQRQRLTIARALVKQPKILILDDSFNALDFATDAALRKALKEYTFGMTCFLVSQRVSTIRNADKIIVLSDGEAVGIGTHTQLMESCQVYQEISHSQMKAEEGMAE